METINNPTADDLCACSHRRGDHSRIDGKCYERIDVEQWCMCERFVSGATVDATHGQPTDNIGRSLSDFGDHLTARQPADEPTEADPPSDLRDAIQDTVYDELAPYIAQPDAEQQEDLEQLRDNVTDAVWRLVGPLLADVEQSQVDAFRDLLRMRALVGGRSAAPTREQIAEVADIIRAHVWPAEPPVPGLVEAGLEPAAEVILALLSRSAAEPPEDHGVRLVHPGCEDCKQVGRVLVPAPADNCTCWESDPESCRVHGVAAEPDDEPRTQLHIGNPMCVCSHMQDEHDDQGDCKGEWRGGECFCDAFDEGDDDD